MNDTELSFFVEDLEFSLPLAESQLTRWLSALAAQHNHSLGALNYIFCSDEYLHGINVEYLDHDTYTDIITFDGSEEEGLLEGDIFISIERVQENASSFGVEFQQEWLRVMAHGLLHLCGFGDKSDQEAKTMREEEDKAIALFQSTVQ